MGDFNYVLLDSLLFKGTAKIRIRVSQQRPKRTFFSTMQAETLVILVYSFSDVAPLQKREQVPAE